MYYLLIYPSCSMYAIIHFPPKKTSIHNHLDGSSTRIIFPYFPTFSHRDLPPGFPLKGARVPHEPRREVKLIDLGRSGNAGGNPQPRWRRGTQLRMSPLRQRGKLGKPMGKTHRTFIEQNDECFSLLKLINYDYKRVYLIFT